MGASSRSFYRWVFLVTGPSHRISLLKLIRDPGGSHFAHRFLVLASRRRIKRRSPVLEPKYYTALTPHGQNLSGAGRGSPAPAVLNTLFFFPGDSDSRADSSVPG